MSKQRYFEFGHKWVVSVASCALVLLSASGSRIDAAAAAPSGAMLVMPITAMLSGPVLDPNAPQMPVPFAPEALYGAMVPGAGNGYLPGESSVGPTGQYNYSLPLAVPDGRAGMAPSLSLRYSSGDTSNGPLGVGWSLSGFSGVARCRKTLGADGEASAIAMRSNDALCLDGQRLTAIKNLGNGVIEYRTARDSYAQILSHNSADPLGPTQFTVKRKDGRVLEYDYVLAKQHSGMPQGYLPTADSEPFVRYLWVLARERDRSGNQIDYAYNLSNSGTPKGLEVLPLSIVYTRNVTAGVPQDQAIAQRRVSFLYETRSDTAFAWQAGVRTNVTHRLKTIEMLAPSPSTTAVVWRYNLGYKQSQYSGRSLLTSVERCGRGVDPATGTTTCQWKKEFSWYEASPTPQFAEKDVGAIAFRIPTGSADFKNSPAHWPYMLAFDADGDGADDLLYQAGKSQASDTQSFTLFRAERNTPTGALQALAIKQFLDPTVFGKTFVHDYLEGSINNMLEQTGNMVMEGTGSEPAQIIIPPTAPLEELSLQHVRPVNLLYSNASQLWVSPNVTTYSGQRICSSRLLNYSRTQNQFVVVPDFVGPNSGQCSSLSLQRDVFLDFDGDGLLDLATHKDPDGPSIYREAGPPPDLVEGRLNRSNDGTNYHYWFDPYPFGEYRGGWQMYHNEYANGAGPALVAVNALGEFASGSEDACELGKDSVHWDYDPAHQTSGTYGNTTYATTRRAIPHLGYSSGLVLDPSGSGRGMLAIGKDRLWGIAAYTSANGQLQGLARCNIGVSSETPISGYADGVDTINHVYPTLAAATAFPGIGPRSTYGDFNGDGLQDKLIVGRERGDMYAVLRWNTGRGWGPIAAVSGLVLPPLEDGLFHAEDFNGDGFSDLIAGNLRSGRRDLYLSSGNGTFVSAPLPYTATLANNGVYGYNASPELFNGTLRIADFNGDGFRDIATVRWNLSSNQASLLLLQQRPQFSDRLMAVFDEPTSEPRESVEYSRLWSDKPEPASGCEYPVQCPRHGPVVVRKISRIDHLTGQDINTPYHLYYSYERPRSDLLGRGFLGFDKVRVWDPQRPMETVTRYNNDKRCNLTYGCDSTVDTQEGFYPLVGRAQRVTTVVPILSPAQWESGAFPQVATARVTVINLGDEVKLLNGNRNYDVVGKAWNQRTWEQQVVIDGAMSNPWNLTSERIVSTGFSSSFPPPAAGVLRERQGTSTFDDWGNLKTSSASTTGGVSQTQAVDYSNNSVDWLIGLPTHVVTTVKEVDSAVLTRTTDMTYTSSGQLDWMFIEKANPDAALRSSQHWVYDGLGLVTQVHSVAGDATLPIRTTRIEYDPMFVGQPNERVYASQVWSPYTPAAYRPSMWMAVHPGYGVVAATMDVNGVQNRAVHDEHGRLVNAKSAGEAPISLSYEGRSDYFAGGMHGMRVKSTVAGAWNWTDTDALGRSLVSTENRFDGGARAGKMSYDRLGRVSAVSRPYDPCPSCQPVFQTVNHYDTLDRLISSVAADATTSLHSQSYFTTESVDANGNKSIETRDVDGRMRTSVNILNGTPVTTTYHYAPSGVDVVTNDKGYTTRTTYDLLGRVIRSVDPDAGTTALTYNGFDDVLTSTHIESGETTHFYYDGLGRPIQEVGPTGQTALSYDVAANGIGKLAAAQSPDDVTTQTAYDSYGRSTGFTQIVKGKSYKVELAYDAQGRLQLLRYPSIDGNTPGLTLKYSYNAAEYLNDIDYLTNMTTYAALWHADGRSLDDGLAQAALGNGAMEQRSYTPELGRLQRLLVTKREAGGAVNTLFDLNYQYYPNGLVKSRNDKVMSRLEEFNYDSLLRMTQWKASYGGSTRDSRYAYDSLGNLLSVTVNQALVESNVYGLPGASHLMPHTLTQQTLGGTVTNYAYDSHGRQIKGGAGARQITKYSDFDLPKTLSANGVTSQLLYDAGGERVAKSSPSAETIYIGGLYEKRSSSAGTTHVFHVGGPDGAIAQVTQKDAASPKVIDYLTTDALGSTGIVMDAAGKVSNRMFFEPFGKRIQATGANFVGAVGDIKHGFTGQEHDDEFGLINFRGRMYDPQLKRMLSADPHVTFPGFGQSWNPYSYVMNSPLNFADPSGFDPETGGAPAPDDSGIGPSDIVFPDDPLYGKPPVSDPPAEPVESDGGNYRESGDHRVGSSGNSANGQWHNPEDRRATQVDENGRPMWNCEVGGCTPIKYIKLPIGTDELVQLVMLRGAGALFGSLGGATAISSLPKLKHYGSAAVGAVIKQIVKSGVDPRKWDAKGLIFDTVSGGVLGKFAGTIVGRFPVFQSLKPINLKNFLIQQAIIVPMAGLLGYGRKLAVPSRPGGAKQSADTSPIANAIVGSLLTGVYSLAGQGFLSLPLGSRLFPVPVGSKSAVENKDFMLVDSLVSRFRSLQVEKAIPSH